ncbi:Piso0_002459 [Millerozyma farinosa CBS 7064]|uniref:Piso0_002459 protein n=1 Tax=Pichia sorbitophila (strain ATCC MYA-4447 / BCRC 22081 / CBS 7064 / NBRC 10061 / NRRL Y-12695) TaxID=559304 RepID=G8YF38_PICSO|nr:Piso0_002459 [Millerozyma farinosa CBS 7064]
MPMYIYICLIFFFRNASILPCWSLFPLKHPDLLFTSTFALSSVDVHASSILWSAAKYWSGRACWFSDILGSFPLFFSASLFPIDAGFNPVRRSNIPFYYDECSSMNLVSSKYV